MVLNVNDMKSLVVVANYDDYDEICFDRMVEEVDRMNQLNVFQYPIDKYLYGNERIKSFRVVFFLILPEWPLGFRRECSLRCFNDDELSNRFVYLLEKKKKCMRCDGRTEKNQRRKELQVFFLLLFFHLLINFVKYYFLLLTFIC